MPALLSFLPTPVTLTTTDGRPVTLPAHPSPPKPPTVERVTAGEPGFPAVAPASSARVDIAVPADVKAIVLPADLACHMLAIGQCAGDCEAYILGAGPTLIRVPALEVGDW